MNNGNEFPKLCDRLIYLFDINNVDIKKRGEAYRFSKDKMSKFFNIEDDNILRNKFRTVQNHYNKKSDSISLEWLNFYHELFNCSIDFLMGYSEQPFISSEENNSKYDINKQLGLNSRAIDTLKSIMNRPDSIEGFNQLLFLNELLFYDVDFPYILKGIYDFLHSKYKYPVHADYIEGRKKAYVDSDTSKVVIKKEKGYGITWIPNNTDLENIDNNTPMVTLASSYEKPNDNIQHIIDESFLETVAMEEIRKALSTIKEQQKETP